MSPEQCRGHTLDPRTDIYSLGCIMFEMACGSTPFVCDGVAEMMAQHLTEPPPVPRTIDPSIPVWLDGIIQRALSKRPEDRHQSMAELVAVLEEAGSRFTAGSAVPQTSLIGATPTGTGAMGSQQRSASLWLAGGMVAVVVAAVGVVGPWRKMPTEVPSPVAVVPTQPPITSMQLPPSPRPPDPAQAMVTLSISSVPPGADIYRIPDHLRIGKTPMRYPLARSQGDAVFLLKLDGYEDRRVELAADHDANANVELTRTPPP
jgi:serine/threonine-protein kinase